MQDTIDIQVTPLSPACGAEIGGIDLSKPLSAHEVRAIREAWNKHLVLVFRGHQVSQDDQLRFASYFGDLGTRKKAPEALRARAEGVQQDHEKVLLVTNIKVDGQPIGARAEAHGEVLTRLVDEGEERDLREARGDGGRRLHRVVEHGPEEAEAVPGDAHVTRDGARIEGRSCGLGAKPVE